MGSKALRCWAMGALVGLASSKDTPSPNPVYPKPECDATKTVSIRYSGTTLRLYLESVEGAKRGGCITLDQIWTARGGGSKTGVKPPLYAINPDDGTKSDTITGTWLLEEDLYIKDGITLKIWGSESGGQADELRLRSDPGVDDQLGTFINLRAHGGSLDFENTKVIGYDTVNNDVDSNEEDGRSYISAVSEIIVDSSETCDGRAKNTMGEARMDVVSSEIAYLGFHDSESYGLTWKVRGFCNDKSNPEVFDEVDVWGNIYDSEIHHMNFAVYTYGHMGGDWRRNKLHSNSGYGFDPHDDSDFLTIHDNLVWDNGYHGIIASKRCNDVSIQGNEVWGGGETSAGIFLHRSSDNAIVKDNYSHDNGDAGMAMMESSNALISGNEFKGNKYGIRMSVGCTDNTVRKNLFSETERYALYTYEGSDPPDVQSSGFSQDNIFKGNTIEGGPQAIKFKESDGNKLIDNVFTDPGILEWSDSTENVVEGNSGLDEATEIKFRGSVCFADSDEAELPLGCFTQEDDDESFSSSAVDISGLEHLGCFADEEEDRVLNDKLTEGGMTLETCLVHCEGHVFMATQYATECWCSDDDMLDYTRHGIADCDMPCDGNEDQSCGGVYEFDLYRIPVTAESESASGFPYLSSVDWPPEKSSQSSEASVTQASSTVVVASEDVSESSTTSVSEVSNTVEPTHLGCFGDRTDDRVMSISYSDGRMTTELCVGLCSGSAFMGTQYGEECFCSSDEDSDLMRYGSATCDMPCAGNEDETCGGSSALSLYEL